MKVNLLINNEEIETDQYTEVRDPGKLSNVVGLVAHGSVQHVDKAIQEAYNTFKSWSNVELEVRISKLLKAIQQFETDATHLANVVSLENGMLLDVSKSEFAMAAVVMRNSAELARSALQTKTIEDEFSGVLIEKKPIGVIAGIVPWNAPIVLTMQKVVPAILAGNTIVIKPSPFAPLGVTLALKNIATFFPPGVINIVHGDADVGTALSTHPLIRKISFTGGGETAKHIMKSAAETLKGIHFELGGNDPAIILDDANLDEIVPKIVNGVFRRSGQFCFAIKRIYLPTTLFDEFYERMCTITDQYKIGHQLNVNATFGPLNNPNQFQNVKRLLERLDNSSANIMKLGQKLEPDNWDNGYYMNPVIVRDIDPYHDLVTCEQFGPIIPLIAYKSEAEVIHMANDSEMGLSSSIWSSDYDRSLQLARKIEAGMTIINSSHQSPLGHKYMPFGGVKQSGIGRENSETIFEEFTEFHAINYYKTTN
ncbi:aldehyde dehydrogenase family protein [Fredinandcohnia sp. FSL W7-1320]|uniref:aldehyde dehydrogenase family protein n=1 Tax=Fredinandcohnia sp. FSL W7-1320 TaxID=2954540 RepID=UPI0030FD4432